MNEAKLKNRDYTLILAKSAFPVGLAPPGVESRWAAAQNSILALAKRCEEFDPDGITVYFPPNEKYERVTTLQIESVLQAGQPVGVPNLAGVLQTALDDYFARKAAGRAKENGAIIIVVMDGEPRDRMAVVKEIVKATHQIDRDDELGIGFAQIGDDALARGFFTALDDDLRSRGAKFDIVDTKVLDQMEEGFLNQFLLDIIYD